jgi:quinol monooxygenase YgiN
MIRAVLTMVVKEGCEADFEREWLAVACLTSREPGSVRQTMLRDLGVPNHYTICADWAEPVHLVAYQGSRQRRALSAALEPLRESATRNVLEFVTDLESGVGEHPGSATRPGQP